MKITLLHISDSDKHFASAIQEYEKRLGKALIIQALKPVKHGNIAHIRTQETQQIIDKLSQLSSQAQPRILLSLQSPSLSTKERSQTIKAGSKPVFIIGGPYGVDEDMLKPHITQSLGFGKHTMPHGLAKLVLFEQVYRIHTLHSGKTYHY